jgi:2,3-bisphosphoglycerate-dependent phosphoglycerate mutase
MEDTKKVTKVLADKGITNVYSSPYKRSVDTIRHFADSCGLEIKTHENFRERNVGTWVEDFKAYSANQWSDFGHKLEGGECLREVQQRNISALQEVLNECNGKSIAIATHGTALSTIINHFKPEFGYEDFWAIIDKMPYILCFKFDDGRFEAIEEIEL